MQHFRIVARPIRAVLVCPQIEPHRDAGFATGQPGGNYVHAVIVKAKPVDDRAISGQSEQARFWVARLRARCGCAQFNKAKTGVGQSADSGCVLVKPRCQADRVGQGQPGQIGGQTWRCDRAGQGQQPGIQQLQCHAMGRFGVKPAQQVQPGGFKPAHVTPSGKMWPFAPRGSSVCHITSSARSAR